MSFETLRKRFIDGKSESVLWSDTRPKLDGKSERQTHDNRSGLVIDLCAQSNNNY